ncbi:DUF1646 domain-containing protein [Clostridium folliculivorans]|uniref:Cation transporter n=1 Tax=Clostridium folliculivorans TaxID=2886038 RepID=A0A9W6DAQ1_9CLOT|nr:DUF1646 domain-containing protein [Clostridium folliculivorans]GKU25052.1 hypothetical protein CFOLD11_18780 [Clostridium folliculivorans]GKU31150.1 hypothetical protein CFB3_32570 [Clostridium folliculivorans]
MEIALVLVLLIILILPLTMRKVEDNLEYFLFAMGILATIISKAMSIHFILEILENHFLYMITFAVLVGGLLFRYINRYVERAMNYSLKHVSLKVFIFTMIILIGLVSSVITAIIAALFLVEIIEMLPVNRENKIKINIIACFSIGLGSILTPIGEPLATIIATKLNLDFWYMLSNIGRYIIPTIIILGILGASYGIKNNEDLEETKPRIVNQTITDIVVKAVKIFIFIIALDMLGAGFRPLVDKYIIQLDSSILYWINMSSAVLDNATLAAAEISSKMTAKQINAITLGLLISGGMMIPGNIPNIISSGRLRIKSSEWMKFGVPLGLIIMVTFYVILFV